jgi:hypothetical protein
VTEKPFEEAMLARRVADPAWKVTDPALRVTEKPFEEAMLARRVADPAWKVTDPAWKVADPAWKVTDPAWKVTDPAWKVADPALRATKKPLEEAPLSRQVGDTLAEEAALSRRNGDKPRRVITLARGVGDTSRQVGALSLRSVDTSREMATTPLQEPLSVGKLTRMSEPRYQHDATIDTMFCSLVGVTIATTDEVKSLAASFEKAWRAKCGGKRVYLVVDYDGFSMEPGMIPAFAEMVKSALSKHVITIVRYGGDSLQRTNARLVGIRSHVPSRLYATKQEAVEVVVALRSGSMRLEPSGA